MNGYDASQPNAQDAYDRAIAAAPNRETKRVLRLIKRAIDAAPAAGLFLEITIREQPK